MALPRPVIASLAPLEHRAENWERVSRNGDVARDVNLPGYPPVLQKIGQNLSLDFERCPVASYMLSAKHGGDMPEIKPKTLEIEVGEMHVVRRLGRSVIAQWVDLPEAVQRLLISQAGWMHDADENVQVREQIRGLIRKHNPNWDGSDA
jgi:hypothetical protein